MYLFFSPSNSSHRAQRESLTGNVKARFERRAHDAMTGAFSVVHPLNGESKSPTLGGARDFMQMNPQTTRGKPSPMWSEMMNVRHACSSFGHDDQNCIKVTASKRLAIPTKPSRSRSYPQYKTTQSSNGTVCWICDRLNSWNLNNPQTWGSCWRYEEYERL